MNAPHLEGLNPEQSQAAHCTTNCLVIAAPGSGKTKMLASKAAHLLSQGKTVTAVTFTRDSAMELKERIVKQAGDSVVRRLLVGTFHSIDMLMAFPSIARSDMGKDILSKSTSKLTKPWSIIKEGARRDAVMRAIGVSGLDLDLIDATSVIEAIKSGYKTSNSDEELELVAAYKELLDRQKVIDFQDILLKTNEGLVSGDISPLSTDHLLLDEFQDTDLPQFDWAMAHARAGSIITAVGDDDQSIYGFRRALGYQGMLRFEEELKAEKIILGLNYRSHAEVLTPANSLIEVNREVRMEKALVSHKGAGGKAHWERFSSEDEVKACLSEIVNAVRENQTFGVLARTNRRLDKIEGVLIREKIPFERSASDSILNSREAELMLSTLNSIVHKTPQDIDRVLAWCGVDEDDLKALHAKFGKNIFDSIANESRDAIGQTPIKDSSKKLIRAMAKRFHEWDVYVKSNAIDFVVSRVYEMLDMYAPNKRSQSILEVVADIFKRPRLSNAEKQPDFVTLLKDVKRQMEAPKKESDATRAVTLMTAHGSKGLEFDVVWILGADMDVFPAKDSQIGSSLQEERRLFYVAMTRAKKVLWISATTMAVSDFVLESNVPRIDSSYFAQIVGK